MNFDERASAFRCHGIDLVGIASVPEQASRRGVLIAVGGPQYRVGSHRQFVLLARSLAAQGIPAMRFDYRGMGDSAGEARAFDAVGDDLRAAIDHFFATVPGMTEVVIWGLCDAASAAMMYGAGDARVCGLVLLNPWVRTSEGHARASLRHDYLERLLQPALWKKIATGRFQYASALRAFASLLGTAADVRAPAAHAPLDGPAASLAPSWLAPMTLPERLLGDLANFNGKVLLILSGRDLTAREFSDLAKRSPGWRRLLGGAHVTRRALGAADHTFSRRLWRDQVAAWTGDWIRSW